MVAEYRYAHPHRGRDWRCAHDYWDLIQGDQPLCRLQYDERAHRVRPHRAAARSGSSCASTSSWSWSGRAHNLGYFFAVGYVASTCYLCYDR